jgi:hypothetical protein
MHLVVRLVLVVVKVRVFRAAACCCEQAAGNHGGEHAHPLHCACAWLHDANKLQQWWAASNDWGESLGSLEQNVMGVITISEANDLLCPLFWQKICCFSCVALLLIDESARLEVRHYMCFLVLKRTKSMVAAAVAETKQQPRQGVESTVLSWTLSVNLGNRRGYSCFDSENEGM